MSENETDPKIAAAEASLTAKYNKNRQKVVPGSVRRAKSKAEREAYGNKLLCTINTIGIDGKPDGKSRVVATSDVWQIDHQPEVKEELRKQQRQEKAKAKKASKPKAKKAETKAPAKETKEERKARLAAAK